MEESITADYALIKAHVADEAGNIVFNKSARNFNIDCAVAGKICIVEVEKIVPTGSLNPEDIHLPHLFVQRIILGSNYVKRIEKLTIKAADGKIHMPWKGDAKIRRERIAKRAAAEMKHDSYINLGIGIPTLATNFLPDDVKVHFHSENGILGLGSYPTAEEADADLINAGKESVTITSGASYFKSSDSFGMVRGGHIDLTFLGGLQVAQNGDLANWIIPGSMIKGMGGAMDLVSGCERLVVTMEHTAKGNPKVLKSCTLPLTGTKVTDMLITDMAVFEWHDGQMYLNEIADDTTLEAVRGLTEAEFKVKDNLGTF